MQDTKSNSYNSIMSGSAWGFSKQRKRTVVCTVPTADIFILEVDNYEYLGRCVNRKLLYIEIIYPKNVGTGNDSIFKIPRSI